MAVLAKIRQRSALMIAVIALALFAFLLPDLFTKGLNRVSNNIGSINGQDIPVEEFRMKVESAEKNAQGITPMQAVNGVWDQEVKRVLLEAQYEKLGLRIGRDQLINVLKENPNFGQNPMFLNDAKMFDKAKFNEYIANIKNTSPEQWKSWLAFEKQVEEMAKEEMYYSMIKAGFVTTNSEAKLSYQMENNKADFEFVSVPFASINDDQVKISDSDITSYMKKNEKKYKAEASRDLEYVLIESKPSTEDENEVKTVVASLLNGRVSYNAATGKNDTLPGFKNATNIEEFVNTNSDIKYDSTYVAKKDLPAEHADKIFNLAKGEIYGPYVFGDYYCITKMMDKKAGANAKASHILLAYSGAMRANPAVTRTKEEAKAKAEELLAQVNANPASFEELARSNSDDSSAQSGGDLGAFGPNMMVKPFNDFVFNNPVGKIGLVETDFGFHVIKITEKQEAVRLATVAQRIESSDATNDQIYTKASKFEMDANAKDFGAVAKEMKLTVVPVNGVLAFDENVQGIGNQRAIVRWAFLGDTEKGAVKKFDIPTGHVIVKVKSINEAGLMSLEAAKPIVTPILQNQKKAEMIKAKMKGGTLEEVAKNAGTAVVEAKALTAVNPLLPNIGPEPEVVGAALGLQAGKTSDLIVGKLGVYKVRGKFVAKAPELNNYASYVNRMKTQNQASVTTRVVTAMKDNAKIKDNRAQLGY
ncbi:peptidylprolyl isomerase [Flavobacterium sp. '19STA2R22 D10 B1']|uniref:peptidylprolyl isomerase n=1 Tax=Flavobacterium aerium TaxID=3037261 RepID=UPI00278BF1DE|nr:peptidylprolyl isomerase [Flavobacterium sp. '19STA2R22 D10 B1']